MKKIVFLDMDGVLADFDSACKLPRIKGEDPPEMFVPGFFRNLSVMPGAQQAVDELLKLKSIKVYIGSKPSSKNFNSATEKFQWVAEHFPKLITRIVLVCDKSLLLGDYLIDDDFGRWGRKFKGIFIHFDKSNSIESWDKVVSIFQDQDDT